MIKQNISKKKLIFIIILLNACLIGMDNDVFNLQMPYDDISALSVKSHVINKVI